MLLGAKSIWEVSVPFHFSVNLKGSFFFPFIFIS